MSGTPPSGLGTSYSLSPLYDEAGRRRQLAFSTSGAGSNGTWTDRFLYDGDALVYRTDPRPASGLGQTVTDLSTTDPNVLYLWGPTGPVMEFDLSGDSRALTFDPRGDCVATSNGRTVKPVFFDGYGKPINSYTGDDRARLQPLQYKAQAGYYTDAYSGLDYCLHRYYSPGLGRWTQRDPIGLDGGMNVYGYCGANPVMGMDPSGLLSVDPGEVLRRAFAQFKAWDAEEAAKKRARRKSGWLGDGLPQFGPPDIGPFGGLIALGATSTELDAGEVARFRIAQIPGLTGLTKYEALAVEQFLIVFNGLAKNGGSNCTATPRRMATKW